MVAYSRDLCVCDACGREHTVVADAKPGASHILRLPKGWREHNLHTYCPACAPPVGTAHRPVAALDCADGTTHRY